MNEIKIFHKNNVLQANNKANNLPYLKTCSQNDII